MGHRHFRALSPGPVSVRTGARCIERGQRLTGAKPWEEPGEEGRPPGTLLPPQTVLAAAQYTGGGCGPRCSTAFWVKRRLLVGVMSMPG